MQSRLGGIAARSTSWAFSSGSALRRGLGTSTPFRIAEPAGHAEDYQAHQPPVPQGMPDESQEHREPETAKPRRTEADDDQQYHDKPKGSTEPLSPPKPPQPSNPRLESTGVSNLADPTLQQKRSNHAVTSPASLDDISCAGIDGSPWPREEEEKLQSREEQLEEEREYYKHHKASPLSETKVADTRKPIRRATDSYYGVGRDAVGWLPEQLDTAEEALRRATEIWKQNAMRGIPEAPHSRVLRALRGEDF